MFQGLLRLDRPGKVDQVKRTYRCTWGQAEEFNWAWPWAWWNGTSVSSFPCPSSHQDSPPWIPAKKSLKYLFRFSDYLKIFIEDILDSCATADEDQVDLVPLFDVILCEAGVVGYEFELAWAELHFGSRLALRFAEPAHCCIAAKE